jgi:hypothetical protein
MLTTTQGWAAFASTPSGFDSFYDLFNKALNDPNWVSISAPSTANPLFTQEEFESARSGMTRDEFEQEILAEFREMGVGKVYVNHGLHNQTRENPFAVRGLQWCHYLPITVGLDFNVGLMCWILGQHRGGLFHYADEIAIQNTNSQQCAQILVERVRGHAPGVEIIGDASGNARKTSSNETDYQIIMQALRGANIPVRNLTPDSNPSVTDRVNIVNAALKSASGQVRLTYDPIKCPTFKRDMERVLWKAKSSDGHFDTKDPKLTHMSDAGGYPIVYHSDVFRKRPGKMHIIVR